MTTWIRCPGLGCHGRMIPETRFDVTVDRCERCDALWFDAQELDRWLGEINATDPGHPESRIPARGLGSRPCPRCVCALDTAGWTGLVLDRCARCRGLFVEAGEFVRMQKEGLPTETCTFESRLAEAMVDAGWGLLLARDLAVLIMRFLLRV
jgi:Zn-finger nucleic acid-binding protein